MNITFRTLLYRTCMAVLSLIIVYAILYRWFDRTEATWIANNLNHGSLLMICNHIGSVFKPFHWFALGVVCFLIGGFLYQNQSKFKMGFKFLFFGGSLIGAFAAAFVFKVVLARYRPELLLNSDLYGFHYFSIKHAYNSTPSGHATMAFAGFFALTRLTENKFVAVLYIIIALIIGLSRLVTLSHFPSDIVFGIYTGILAVYWSEFILSKICKRHTAS